VRGCRRAARRHLQRYQEDGLDGAAAGVQPDAISGATKMTARGRAAAGVQPGAISNTTERTASTARLPACSPAPSPTPPRGRPRRRGCRRASRRHLHLRRHQDDGPGARGCRRTAQRHLHLFRHQEHGLEDVRLPACSPAPSPSPLWYGAPKTAASRLPAGRSGAISSPIEPCDYGGAEDETRRQPACIRRHVHLNEPCCLRRRRGCRRAAQPLFTSYGRQQDDGPDGARLPARSPAPSLLPSTPTPSSLQRGMPKTSDDGLLVCKPAPSPSPRAIGDSVGVSIGQPGASSISLKPSGMGESTAYSQSGGMPHLHLHEPVRRRSCLGRQP